MIDFGSTTEDKQALTLLSRRFVTKDSLIPVLYRYKDESIIIKLYDDTGNLYHEFNSALEVVMKNLEQNINRTGPDVPVEATSYERYLFDNFGEKAISKTTCWYGSPWSKVNEEVKKRVEYFIHGQSGYISDKYVNYDKTNGTACLDNYAEDTQLLEEIVVEYHVSGDYTTHTTYYGGSQAIVNERLVNSTEGTLFTLIVYRPATI